MAVWMPVTVVPTSLATCAMDTFITELSSVIRNCAEARVSRTDPAAPTALVEAGCAGEVIGGVPFLGRSTDAIIASDRELPSPETHDPTG